MSALWCGSAFSARTCSAAEHDHGGGTVPASLRARREPAGATFRDRAQRALRFQQARSSLSQVEGKFDTICYLEVIEHMSINDYDPGTCDRLCVECSRRENSRCGV